MMRNKLLQLTCCAALIILSSTLSGCGTSNPSSSGAKPAPNRGQQLGCEIDSQFENIFTLIKKKQTGGAGDITITYDSLTDDEKEYLTGCLEGIRESFRELVKHFNQSVDSEQKKLLAPILLSIENFVDKYTKDLKKFMSSAPTAIEMRYYQEAAFKNREEKISKKIKNLKEIGEKFSFNEQQKERGQQQLIQALPGILPEVLKKVEEVLDGSREINRVDKILSSVDTFIGKVQKKALAQSSADDLVNNIGTILKESLEEAFQ